ncbi:hypothetical protein [Devosia sp.]|uniref:hypothetical protein n=1 Tax=Devosia sp. TaxID=1871048 RepID=UPI002EDC7C80
MSDGNMRANDETARRELRIASGAAVIEGMLELPAHPGGIVLFAHGSGSSRFSPRNNFVAAEQRQAGLGTLLLDLLTPEEDAVRDAPLRRAGHAGAGRRACGCLVQPSPGRGETLTHRRRNPCPP